MQWTSVLSTEGDLGAALADATGQLLERHAQPIDLVVVFASSEYRESWSDLPARLSTLFPDALVFGSSAQGVLGEGEEHEQGAALVLMGATLPGVRADVMMLPEASDDHEAWAASLDIADAAGVLLLMDPFTCDAERVLEHLDGHAPRVPKVGGLASGGSREGEHAFFCTGGTVTEGGIALVLRGSIVVRPVVAQGCRPLGEPMIVMRRRGHLIDQLDRGRPVDVIRELLSGLEPGQRERAAQSLFLGLDVDSDKLDHEPTDFLIRSLIGVDPESGSLAVAARLRDYQVVRFYVRDGDTADEDLRQHVSGACGSCRPRGGVAFCCMGRGQALFGQPNHDAGVLRDGLGPGGVAGLFCNGEIGPVGSRTYLHSYTATVALFCAPPDLPATLGAGISRKKDTPA